MRVLSGACFLIVVAAASAALAQVDIRSPWANVYVGPGGVYVHGPWGRVDVPSADRERVCDQWRESILDHYKGQNCKVTFNDDNCTVKDVDCAEEGSGKGTDEKDNDTGEGPKEL
jgi:hypothetical protein